MTTYKFIQIIFFTCTFFSLNAIANESEENEKALLFYGKIDAIYLQESRIVIDDMSMAYTNDSIFRNSFGRKISVKEINISNHNYVKYQKINNGQINIIQKLSILTEQDYNYIKAQQNLINH